MTTAFIAGFAYGLTSVCVGQPFDTVKTRMQTCDHGAHSSSLRTARTILAQEGVKGLYRGGWSVLVIPATRSKHLIDRPDHLPFVLAGACLWCWYFTAFVMAVWACFLPTRQRVGGGLRIHSKRTIWCERLML